MLENGRARKEKDIPSNVGILGIRYFQHVFTLFFSVHNDFYYFVQLRV